MTYKIPLKVKQWARLGCLLKKKKYAGATQTGIDRGKMLSQQKHVTEKTVSEMRHWFARHGPGAINGGTSYQNGNSIIKFFTWYDGNRKQEGKTKHKAFVSWCLWGGDAGFLWIQRLSKELKGKLHAKVGNYRKYVDKIEGNNIKIQGGLQNESEANNIIRYFAEHTSQVYKITAQNKYKLLYILLRALKKCDTNTYTKFKIKIDSILEYLYDEKFKNIRLTERIRGFHTETS